MTWDEAEKAFAEHFDGYEPRLSQRGLAERAEKALTESAHLAAQAPCGVGKSYAAQVVAVDYSRETGYPVVLATATKALQDQYIKDAEALQVMYKPFKYAVVKGRSNYACKAKIAEGPDLTVAPAELVKALDAAEGDLDRVALTLTPRDRQNLSTSSDECPGRKGCKFGETCYAERVKDKAQESQVVIVNHSLLVLDAVLKGGEEGKMILPQYSAVIVDEAHELESYATSILGQEIRERQIKDLIVDAGSFLDDEKVRADGLPLVTELFAGLTKVLPPTTSRENTATINPELLLEIGEPLADLVNTLKSISVKVNALYIHGDDDRNQKRKRLLTRLGNMRARLGNVLQADFGDMVRWVERQTKTNNRTRETWTETVLRSAPLSVAEALRAYIWNIVPGVLMSATLAVDGKFDYLAERLGLGRDLQTFDCESPFDFTTQARLYIPEIPDPTSDRQGYNQGVVRNMHALVKASNGRALLLFTSWESLRNAYAVLEPEIRNMGHRVLRQGDMGARQLTQAFVDDEHSVLFAVKSFFTGIDVRGDSLRLVVIDKMPFPVPSDVIFAARAQLIDAKATRYPDKAFNKLSIPMMTLDLMQGFGRLIRSTSDAGVVAILDPRLHPDTGKSYTKPIRRSLPPAPVITKLDEVVSYLEKLDVTP